MNESTNMTLVLHGNGKTGRRVASRLVKRGIQVRSASRGGTPPFDWEQPGGWPAVLDGVRSVYLAYHPDLAAPTATAHIRQFVAVAIAGGVDRLVLLSGRGEPRAAQAEEIVRDSGAAFTILRSAFFCQNFSEGALLESVLSGEVVFPAQEVGEPFIDIEDLADVAVATLTSDEHIGRTYELTGPRLLTFADAAAEITRVTERAIRFRAVSSQQYAAMLEPYVPAETATFLADLFAGLLDGHNAHVTDDLEHILGRKPTDFREFARAAAASGAWDALPVAATAAGR